MALATTCDTSQYSSAGRQCLTGCAQFTSSQLCQRQQCFITCAQQEPSSANQQACVISAQDSCNAIHIGVNADPTCDCNNVPASTVAAASQNGCASASQAASFQQCEFPTNGACAQVAAYNPPSLAPQSLQCQCATAVQQCQQTFAPCFDATFGTASYSQSACQSAGCAAFDQCVAASGSACAQVQAQSAYGGATATQQCQCSQQAQQCQVQYPGCTSSAFGTQAYHDSSCVNNNNNNNYYGNTYGYNGYGATYYTTNTLNTLIAEADGGGAAGLVLLLVVIGLIVCMVRRRRNKQQPSAAEPSKVNVAENNPLFEQNGGAKDNPIFYETQSSLGSPPPAVGVIGNGQSSDYGTQSNFNTVDFAKQDPKAALYPNLSEQALPVLQTRPSQQGRINDARMLSARFEDPPPLYGDNNAGQFGAPPENGGPSALYPGVAKI